MEKAFEKDLKEKKLRFGGSTISQQLAKNLYLPLEEPLRKMKEAVITWRIERTLPKKRILEIYLNVAEWGEGIFGAEAASEQYYGKPASSLTANEAARLPPCFPIRGGSGRTRIPVCGEEEPDHLRYHGEKGHRCARV